MRSIGVVTTSRADYSLYRPLLAQLQDDPELRLRLYVSGSHLVPEQGMTRDLIKADGFEVAEHVESLVASDSPEAIAKSMGLTTLGFAQAFSREQPHLLVVLGDRFEMHAAAVAALPFLLPIAHIHGGELTLGAIDDGFRHSLTKLSHLHFTSAEPYADRIRQMGEEPWRVTTCGALSMDALRVAPLLSEEEFAARFGLPFRPGFILATLHAATLECRSPDEQIGELLAALRALERPVLFTASNADAGGREINRRIAAFVHEHPWAHLVDSLGPDGYPTAMSLAGAMVGNSSSGIVEAGWFRLPVVNIGSRQEGRIRGENVIDVGLQRDEIRQAIQRALSPEFRAQLHDLPNVYGNGYAAEMITEVLREAPLGERLLRKRFVTVPAAVEPEVQRVKG